MIAVCAGDGDDFQGPYEKALELSFNGDYHGALSSLEALSKKVPDNTEVLFSLAMIKILVGHYEEAYADVRLILENDPEHYQARQFLANRPLI